MKKNFCVCLIIALIVSTFSGCVNKKTYLGEIKIFTWGEYISDGSNDDINVLREFEKETGIKVSVYDTYDSNEQMYAKLKSGTSDYDIIFPSDYMISRMIDEDMLLKLDFSSLLNYSNIIDDYKGNVCGYDLTNEYSVPYAWGTVGIIYNEPLVEKLTNSEAHKIVDGWDVFWNEDLKDNILMFINSRDSFMISQKLLGYSLNTNDQQEIFNAYDKLTEQKPLVQAYLMDEMFDKMLENEAAISPAYSGDIITMQNLNKDLKYCFPKQGSNLFVDCACIPKSSKNHQNAHKFIDFLLKSDIAACNAKFLNYSTPNLGAYSLLDDDLKNNKIAYPDSHTKNNCETFIALDSKTTYLMDDLFIKVRK